MNSETRWKMSFAFVIILTAIGLIGLFWLDTVKNDFMGIQPKPYFDAVNEGEFDEATMKKGEAGVLGASLYLRILPPSTKEEGRFVKVTSFKTPELLLRDDDPKLAIKSACIVGVFLQVSSSESPQGGGGNLVKSWEPVCHHIAASDRLRDTYTYEWTSDVTGEQEGSVELDHVYLDLPMEEGVMQSFEEFNPLVVGSNFWFPYDPFNLTLQTYVKTKVEYEDGSVEYQFPPAYIEFQLLTSGGRSWYIKMDNELKKDDDLSQSYSSDAMYQETRLNLVRPLLFRIAFPLIVSAMVFFIAMIPQISNPNVETVLGIMASLLFATFAVRSILLPGDQIGQTILDGAILGLYTLQILAGGLLMWRVKRFGKKTEQETDLQKAKD